MARHVAQNLFDDPAEELATARRCTLGRADAAPQPRRVRRPDECHWRTYDLRSCAQALGQAIVTDSLGTAWDRQDDPCPVDRSEQRGQVHRVVGSFGRRTRGSCGDRRSQEEPRRDARTILFIDEIHRFNKAQQDALLGAVEDGTDQLDRRHHRKPFVRGQFCVTIALPRGRSRAARAGRHRHNHPPCAGRLRTRAGRTATTTHSRLDRQARELVGGRRACGTLDAGRCRPRDGADRRRNATR